MAVRLSVLSLRVVKERSGQYEFEDKIVSSPDKVRDILEEVFELSELAEEVFILVCLDTKNKVTGLFKVSQGSLNSSIVHPREVFKRALMQNASSIILAHNHPSGDTTPSLEDISITKRLYEAGNLLGVEVLDHIIVGANGKYKSFKEDGLF
jgi:DNA repair protein RadC